MLFVAVIRFFRKFLPCVYLGFHNRLNRRIERAHANIWPFIGCIVDEESRFQYTYIQINIGVQWTAPTYFH